MYWQPVGPLRSSSFARNAICVPPSAACKVLQTGPGDTAPAPAAVAAATAAEASRARASLQTLTSDPLDAALRPLVGGKLRSVRGREGQARGDWPVARRLPFREEGELVALSLL